MELFRALGLLIEPPAAGHARVAATLGLPDLPEEFEYTDLFLFQLYPYASVYLGNEGMLGGAARDRIAGLWRALELDPPPEPDHLAVLLALYATLFESERQEREAARRKLRREARKALLYEHLLSWLPAWLHKLDEIGTGFYRDWGTLLLRALHAEAKECGPPDLLPLHYREALGLPPADALGLDALLELFLAPVRSGVILVREDLRRAARELGCVARVAERRYVLRELLANDATATLRWLSREAERWAALHEQIWIPPLGDFWRERAEGFARWIADLQ